MMLAEPWPGCNDTKRWKFGDVVLTKVVEFADPMPLEVIDRTLTNATTAEIEAMDWLKPRWVRDGMRTTTSHCFLIETPTSKLVVDTGVGDCKQRYRPAFSNLTTGFLDRFREIFEPDDIDAVICTHMHVDHVGWNTTLHENQWHPTFPNADYHFVRQEYEYWAQRAANGTTRTDGGDRPTTSGNDYAEWEANILDVERVFEDSLQPIVEAGLVQWTAPDERIADEVSLWWTPGHTPGHVAVLIDSKGSSAAITGDLIVTPAQVVRPDWAGRLDSDPDASTRSRRAFIDRFADTGTVVIGSHFENGYVVRRGTSCAMVPAD